MKKYLVLLFSLVLVFSLALSGCSNSDDNQSKEGENNSNEENMSNDENESNDEANSNDESESNDQSNGEQTEGAVSLGFGVLTNVEKSKEASNEDGVVESDSLAAAVLVDADGKIIKAVIDQVQVVANFDNTGKIKTPLDTKFATKNDLKEEYGMKAASGIGKEWNEQAEFFADYIKGKTLEEIKGIKLADDMTAADDDLKAGVTIKVGSFIEVVEKAMNNLKPGANADDMLGLGITSSIDKSKEPGDEDGLIQAYMYYVAGSFDKDNKVTVAIADATQAEVNFSKEGKITSDIEAAIKSKNELGDDYGMKKASKLGKEWNEQAKAFSDYIAGKTLEEVKGIALEEGGQPAGEDLKASVTIHVNEMQETLEKAFELKK